MIITRAQLNNYRSYISCELVPCEGVNVLLGDNGQGKTNVLEALYVCCTGRSHRTRQDRELIRWGEDFASVKVEAQRRDGSHEVEILMPALGRRRIKIAGQEISRSGELMGHVTGVLFSPEDLRTVKDGPAERRRFVDMALSQIKPAYYYALQRYARALKQRNEALKAVAAQPAFMATLDAWDEQLATAGAELMRHRRAYVEQLSRTASETHRSIADGREKLEIRYLPSVTMGDDVQSNLEALFGARENDVRRMTTTVGAHRDDVQILVEGRDVRAFGSQGQQRTAALSMRLSELDVMREQLGEWPMLMLDDVMSELDPGRRRQLVSHLKGIQTFITCTDAEDLAGAEVGRAWRVENGELREA
ncbi:MAG: DNA replication/repair protein RecF [Clostridia bacterium]|nr:DNA replication/repair protein RecF [Clostridia bacterium]